VVNDALRSAASVLGNTLAVCRKSYVHPGVVSAFLDGTLRPRASRLPANGLRANERRTLGVLLALERAAKAAAKAQARVAKAASGRPGQPRTMRGVRVPDALLPAATVARGASRARSSAVAVR
jgi:DNA topoisomerase-1